MDTKRPKINSTTALGLSWAFGLGIVFAIGWKLADQGLIATGGIAGIIFQLGLSYLRLPYVLILVLCSLGTRALLFGGRSKIVIGMMVIASVNLLMDVLSLSDYGTYLISKNIAGISVRLAELFFAIRLVGLLLPVAVIAGGFLGPKNQMLLTNRDGSKARTWVFKSLGVLLWLVILLFVNESVGQLVFFRSRSGI